MRPTNRATPMAGGRVKVSRLEDFYESLRFTKPNMLEPVSPFAVSKRAMACSFTTLLQIQLIKTSQQ